MGYLHIDNLYKNQDILLFRECYALEKIHGTSAHLSWKDGKVVYFSGGEKFFNFLALFNEAQLIENFTNLGHSEITIFGECYAGSQQGQSWRYGKQLKFIAFDVQIGDSWLDVPAAENVVKHMGLEYVHYVKVSTDLEVLNAERDAPSVQAQRNGVEGSQPREGVVLRPLIELTSKNGSRIISKHKRDEERETAKPRAVVDPAKLEVLTKANEIADEWIVPTQLEHILQKMPAEDIRIEKTRDVIEAMIKDVLREAKGEIVANPDAIKQSVRKQR